MCAWDSRWAPGAPRLVLGPRVPRGWSLVLGSRFHPLAYITWHNFIDIARRTDVIYALQLENILCAADSPFLQRIFVRETHFSCKT